MHVNCSSAEDLYTLAACIHTHVQTSLLLGKTAVYLEMEGIAAAMEGT
jgi:hypothetical protein